MGVEGLRAGGGETNQCQVLKAKPVSGLEKSVLHLFDHLAYGGAMDPQMRGDFGIRIVNCEFRI